MDPDRERFQLSLFALRGMLRSYWDIGMAVKAGNDELIAELQSAMDALQEEGALGEIMGRHGVSYVKPVARSGSG